MPAPVRSVPTRPLARLELSAGFLA